MLVVWYRGKANIERPVLSFWEDANRMQAEEEEVHLVREFEERLKYNLQQVRALPLTCIHTAWGPMASIDHLQNRVNVLALPARSCMPVCLHAASALSTAAVKMQAIGL